MKNPPYSAASDLWSVGIVVYELATQANPYAEITTTALLAGDVNDISLAEDVDPVIKEVVQKILVVDIEQRT